MTAAGVVEPGESPELVVRIDHHEGNVTRARTKGRNRLYTDWRSRQNDRHWSAYAERLPRAVALEAGESFTEAVHKSLEEKLLRLSGRRVAVDLAAAILRIGQRCSALPDMDTRSPEDILGYNPSGTPG